MMGDKFEVGTRASPPKERGGKRSGPKKAPSKPMKGSEAPPPDP